MRYLITFAIVLAVIVFGFIIFRGGGPENTPVAPRTLPSLASTDAEMRYTIDGSPINSDQEHRSVQIVIGRTQSTVTIFRGYEGRVLKSKSYANNQNAYEAFLSALERLRYSAIKRGAQESELGACPLGNRYIYEVINNGDQNTRSWSTSCGGQGNFGGTNAATTRKVFQNQIPDYREFIQGIPGIQV